MINLSNNLITPYLYIEDELMYHFRQSGNWKYKGMPPEIIDPLMRIHQNQVYTIGQRRILWKMIRGHDFKVITSQGWCSYQYVCGEILRESVSRTGSLPFRLLPTVMNETEERSCDPPLISPFSYDKQCHVPDIYARYIGSSLISDMKKRVGRCAGGTLLIHSPSPQLPAEYMSRDRDPVYDIRYNLKTIIKKLFKGEDFILYPYGYSLQDFLSRLTSRRDIIYTNFRLLRKDSHPKLKIPGLNH